MKTRFFMSLFLCATIGVGVLPAQETTPAAPPSAAQIAEYQKRFEEGYALQKAGKLTEARAVYDGILAEQADAKRSLLEAGRISLKLQQWDKADAYLSRLHALVPDFPEAYELLIQANQGLKRDVKVERLVREFTALHDSGKSPEFAQSLNFVREQVQLPTGDNVVFVQYFSYTEKPFIVWKAQVLDAAGGVKRQLVLAYDQRGTAALKAKNPNVPNAEQFLLVEDVLSNGKPVRVDAYFQVFSLSEYKKIRNTMLAVLGGAYKPVYSQAIDAGSGQ